jgi:hypothetical protein
MKTNSDNSEIIGLCHVGIHDSEGNMADVFGVSAAISGSRVIVGARGDNTGAAQAGSAYVYDISNAAPRVPMIVLTNPSPAAADYFGQAVGISGNRAVVGAYLDNTGATDAGSAYVYDLDGATPNLPMLTLTNPSPAVSNYFGSSVAISGTRVLVGAFQDDHEATDAGSAYIFDLANATPTVPVSTLANPSPAMNDYFGFSVAIDDGGVWLGAPSGAANPVTLATTNVSRLYRLLLP